MIVRCQQCGKTYRVDAARLAGKTRVRLRCAGCKAVIEAPVAGAAPGAPKPPAAEPEPADRTSVTKVVQDAGLASAVASGSAGPPSLPEGKRVTLAILSGPDQGKMLKLSRPRLVLGRAEGDVLIDDPEASRRHASVEVYGERFLVRDLGSTNGTFVSDERISAVELADRGEFQIGATRIMLILSDGTG